jgi:hypothetical protein
LALVRLWAQATRAAKSALLLASRNDNVRAMNELAQEAVRERIGDVLVGRERAHGGVNGHLYTLLGM